MKARKHPIVIKKIKKNTVGGHHGGMWKVAYADFITAMMVLFLMLWIINNAPKETLNSLGNYFEPTLFKDTEPKPSDNTLKKIEVESAASVMVYNKLNPMIDPQVNKNIKLEKSPDSVSIVIESTDSNPIFAQGDAELTVLGKQQLEYLSQLISKLPYYITISAHTNGLEKPITDAYSNWNLSLDRVNNTRKFLLKMGISDDRVIYIVGSSNSLPKYENNPTGIQNRRIEISLIVNDELIGPSKKNLPTDVFK